MRARYLIVCVFVLFMPGCALMPGKSIWGTPSPPLLKLAEEDVPLLDDDLDTASLETAISRSLEYLDRGAGERYRFGDCEYTAAEVREGLLDFRAIVRASGTNGEKMKRIREGFDVYKALGSDGKGAVVFTGYYEPVLNGSLEATDRYRYPLYKVPADLLANGAATSYLSREEIDGRRALAGQGLEIAWVDDPVALFFLHIQGSGMIKLPDGRVIQVSYARSNNRAFRGIAKYMAERGFLSPQDLSNETIKKYLREHTDEQEEIFQYNERYIFFRLVDNGPIGALGVTVTGGRTIAIDPEVYPKAGISFIRLRKPVFDQEGRRNGWVPFSRFVLSQDAGAAIKGPGRIDLFCGGGGGAEQIAGSLKEKGELYFLVKKKTRSDQ